MLACYGFGSAVDISGGVVAVGAPRAKRPCAIRTRSGAVFTYVMPDDGYGMRSRDLVFFMYNGGSNPPNRHFPMR